MKEKLRVKLVDREEMSLLGLMMARIIERSVSNEKGEALLSRLKGKLGVTAGNMSITLDFDGGCVTVLRGLHGPLKAAVVGSLIGLLNVSVEHRPVRSFIAGEVALKGNPFFAYKVLPLFYVTKEKDLKV